MELQFNRFQLEPHIALHGQLFQETGNGDAWGQVQFIYFF